MEIEMAVRKSNLIQAVETLGMGKAVLFDMDGLIFDTERLFMEQLAVVMREYGYRLTREIYCNTLGMGGRLLRDYMCGQFGENYPFEEISEITVKRVEAVADTVGFMVKPGICELLGYLMEKKIFCAVASSTHTDRVERYLEQAGLLGYFSAVIGGEMVERSKPFPDIFLLACERAESEPGDCIVLEDSENGVRAAHQAGCKVICVPDLKPPSEEILLLADVLV